jgi:hypothetical protein
MSEPSVSLGWAQYIDDYISTVSTRNYLKTNIIYGSDIDKIYAPGLPSPHVIAM